MGESTVCLSFNSMFVIWLFLQSLISVAAQIEEMPVWRQQKPVTAQKKKKKRNSIKAQANAQTCIVEEGENKCTSAFLAFRYNENI